jgi:general stress protein 26
MNDLDYGGVVGRMEKLLADTKYATLANVGLDGVPRTSQMCLISDGLTIYMQTDIKLDKIKNIRENPNVSVNIGAYNFSGRAEIAGHPSENQWFIDTIKKKHSDTYEKYTNLSDEVLLKIKLSEVRIWGDVDGTEGIRRIDFDKKTVSFSPADHI